MEREDVVGVVVAGGSSVRFGGGTPKQFLDLCGGTVIQRSIRCLASHPEIRGVVVVLPAGSLDSSHAGAVRSLPGVTTVVEGGETRARSSRNGIAASGPAPFVLVHDAARPLAPPALVDRVIRATREHGAAVPVLPVADTVKRVDRDGILVEATLDRHRLRYAQTPQGAGGSVLLHALDEAEKRGEVVTDEASALEAAGHPVHLVDGSRRNRKITSPADLEDARHVLCAPGPADLRVGTGFDVHRFGGGGRLVLGGVEFPGEPGLEGHSDADVVLHAAMDALLGAACLGDIGMHFPPDDSRFRGAQSTDLARRVSALLGDAGCEVVNVDLTLLAERPRVRTRVDDMRREVAAALGIEVDRVGIKATTLEGLGSLGRREGIACQATALVLRRGPLP